jgi:hypothetical protein
MAIGAGDAEDMSAALAGTQPKLPQMTNPAEEKTIPVCCPFSMLRLNWSGQHETYLTSFQLARCLHNNNK